MKIKYAQEKKLLDHYNKYVHYSSPVRHNVEHVITMFNLRPKLDKQSNVLDVGCGDGHVIRYIQENFGCNSWGVDYSEKRIEYARKHNRKCNFIVGDVNFVLHNISDDFFDLIMLFETLEHLLCPVEIMDQCRRILKPDGLIIGSVPLNSTYIAHLQVYKSFDDVESRLGVKTVYNLGNQFAFFKTGKDQ